MREYTCLIRNQVPLVEKNHAPFPSGAVIVIVAVGGVLALLCFVLLGGGRISATKFKEWRGGNAWYLTYEGTALDGPSQFTTVRYGNTPDRFKPDHEQKPLGPGRLPWNTKVFVSTGQEAFVEVTPAEGTTAACRILLDGVRVVAEGKSPAPGQPAVCKVTTSSTPEKWPRD
ncbi:hypothetical protein ACFQ8K_41210 [Streptomyces erythrochromogenes]|uniref:hypothetical protein n=1 Tax=Streptomyces erythrochromogenes TaxID=285574 RepID=UPI0036A50C6D